MIATTKSWRGVPRLHKTPKSTKQMVSIEDNATMATRPKPESGGESKNRGGTNDNILARYCAGEFGRAKKIDASTCKKLWTEAIQTNWKGNMGLLPDIGLAAFVPVELAGVVLDRSMLARLRDRFPRLRSTCQLVAVFHGWIDMIDTCVNENDIKALAFDAVVLGNLDVFVHALGDGNRGNVAVDAVAQFARTSGARDRAHHVLGNDNVHADAVMLVDWAAHSGNVALVAALTERGAPASIYAMDVAATFGHLPLVQWLHTHRATDGCTRGAMDGAARHGHLHVAKWLHTHRFEGCSRTAMDAAASAGHIHMVTWLHNVRREGCTTDAMDAAARNGYLGIVTFLHVYRREGCTTAAMDMASSNGHLKIVQFLHTYRVEGCTTTAMDLAASHGHIHVIEWLNTHRVEGCTSAALDGAARNGHADTVRFLCTHHLVDVLGNVVALAMAVEAGHVDVVGELLRHGAGFSSTRWWNFGKRSSQRDAVCVPSVSAMRRMRWNLPYFERTLLSIASMRAQFRDQDKLTC